MQFDPSIAAQSSFKRAQEAEELGDDLDAAREAEETFSSSAGAEAKSAYEQLQQIGKRYPHAKAFQEFLIHITWQQVTEETIPVHFRKGLELCDQYLATWNDDDSVQGNQVRELRISFRAGLGLDDEEDNDYDLDTFKGGD
ncbi:MAG TPA: hypothetical protein VJ692_09750 [Nitrospiraceae bacterium]|nr:hypothetical protein [Nitrospiraceae bacterium]